MNALLKPIITEKATRDSELMNCYTLEVTKTANKFEIKKESLVTLQYLWKYS